MSNRSKLISISIRNVGCIGNEGLTIDFDDIVCLVGRNNCGKSTVLMSYELAYGKETFTPQHRCLWSPENEPSEVILDVHIPEGIGNVDSKWKEKRGDLLVVRSRWQWESPIYKSVRTTWDPESQAWAEDGKAAGADPVFKSRLPRPIRVGSLDDATNQEETMLAVALSPLLAEVKKLEQDESSAIFTQMKALVEEVQSLTSQHANQIESIGTDIGKGFQNIFPGLGVRLHVEMATPKLKLGEFLKSGSSILVADCGTETGVRQQGTGARRALFWAMVQVHNQLERALESSGAKDKAKAKKEKKTPTKKSAEPEGSDADDDPSLPGYLLLMDEPENALHPMAARAAQKHLYQLAKDPDWQVMLTTHSPYFVNPLEDHTTIIRLERPVDMKKTPITPRTFRSDSVAFDGPTKSKLRAVQNMDAGLAEIFFGAFPVLVEGDTEHAVFVATYVEPNDPMSQSVTIIRARGKAVLVPIISILKHFKVPFAVIHDSDSPRTKSGDKNGMWTENKKIREAVVEARGLGLTVRHVVSLPDFERFLGGQKLGKDKPLAAYEAVLADPELQKRCRKLFADCFESTSQDLFDWDGSDLEKFQAGLLAAIQSWAATTGKTDDPRFKS